jgi:hypothetical protein
MNKAVSFPGAAVVGLWLTLSLLAGGCASMGPKAMRGNRTAYNASIQQGDKEELLLNLVRIRYGEPPFFMSVGSISSSFNFQVDAGINAQLNNGPVNRTVPSGIDKSTGLITGYTPYLAGYPYTQYNPSLQFQYYESPTITYTPLQGEKYLSQMLAEVDLSRLLFLVRTNCDAGFLFDVLVTRIGDVRNPAPGDQDTPEMRRHRERFSAISAVLSQAQSRGDLQLRLLPTEKDGQEMLLLQFRLAGEQEAEALDKVFGVSIPRKPLAGGGLVAQIRLRRGMDFLTEFSRDADAVTLSVSLRNLLDVLAYLSWGVEVPPPHLEEGLVPREEGSFAAAGSPFPGRWQLSVTASALPPARSFVAVRHEGIWFAIAANDNPSKETFGFLMLLLAMESGDPRGSLPVLTIPVGGGR